MNEQETKSGLSDVKKAAVQLWKSSFKKEPIGEELMRAISEKKLIEKCEPHNQLTYLLKKAKEVNNQSLYALVANFCSTYIKSSPEERKKILSDDFDSMKNLVDNWNNVD